MKYLNELKAYDKVNRIRHSKEIKKSFRKHARIHKRALEGRYIYDADRVEHVINFIEGEFYKTTGELELITLQPVQKWWLEMWFGYYTLEGDILINETFLNIIRGAGKSTIMAAIEIYWMIFGGNYGGQSIVIAYDNNQTEHVFGQVRNQLTAGDGLLSMLGETKQLKTTKTGIEFVPNKNKFKRQTNDKNRVQGGNTSLNLFDEVHVYLNDIVTPVNTGSRQKQSSWRSIYITSGGVIRGFLYDDMIKRFSSADEFKSDRTMSLIYQLDDPSEVTNKNNWSKAAPMIKAGLPKMETVLAEYNNAKNDPAKQIMFLAYNMGLTVSDSSKYLMANETVMTPYDFDQVWSGANVVVGIDVAMVGDLTGVVFLTNIDDVVYAHVEALGSKDTMKRLPKHIADRLEHIQGLTITDGSFVKTEDIVNVVTDFYNRTNCNFTHVGYDPNYATYLQSLIEDYFFDSKGDRQISVRQGWGMSEYIKIMKAKLGDKTLIHNSEILEWSLENFAIKVGSLGDVMATKLTDGEKIDPVVALVIALKVLFENQLNN